MGDVLAGEQRISAQIEAIGGFNQQIQDTKELKAKKEQEKVSLDSDTITLRDKKKVETAVLQSLQA